MARAASSGSVPSTQGFQEALPAQCFRRWFQSLPREEAAALIKSFRVVFKGEEAKVQRCKVIKCIEAWCACQRTRRQTSSWRAPGGRSSRWS
mmetsp:Transcript_26580/g.84320  ORF Transcript_26580/g.84320 Transcript_26580/m.84320 type:complete len:92 (+) Transcript_26580:256-531(+)